MADQEKTGGGAGSMAPGRYSDPGDKGRTYPKKGAEQSAPLNTDWNPCKGPMPKEA